MGNPYQRWTAKERDKSARITKMMIEAGQIPPAIVCVLCGQTEGIMQARFADKGIVSTAVI
jgi:hypothetical protein